MKKILFICFALCSYLHSNAQRGSADVDAQKIVLNVYIPQQSETIPTPAKGMLSNKLAQIATVNGMAGGNSDERFIITSNVVVTDKNITSTAPTMVALTLEVSFYIGDGIDGIKFAGTSINVKGVGTNEAKAYISAFKNINPDNPDLQRFVQSGKARIVEYYRLHCDQLIAKAQGLANQKKYDEALYNLTSVPEVCQDCYVKSINAVTPIYKREIDDNCQIQLAKAKSAWAANQNIDGANAAGDIISTIDPGAAGYKNVIAFIAEITKKIKENDDREWAYQVKQQKQDDDVIKAARDIGVAYAANQPSYSYNIVGWFD